MKQKNITKKTTNNLTTNTNQKPRPTYYDVDIDSSLYDFKTERLGDFLLVKPSITEEELAKKPRFFNIYGNDEVKQELENFLSWFERYDELTKRGVSVPKGAILCGCPGCGKTMMLKEIIRTTQNEVFIYSELDESFDVALHSLEMHALKTKKKIIFIIDELDDLLCNSSAIDALKNFMDGVIGCPNILIIGACNNEDNLYGPLFRNGRFEKILKVLPPIGEENVQYFKDSFKKFDVKIPEEFDDNDYISILNETAFSTIKSITNDVVLRNGFENITIKNIDDSIAYVLKKTVGRVEKPTYRAAVHEASHAFIAYLNPEVLGVNRVGIENIEDPLCINRYSKKEALTYSEYISKIEFSLAGIIGEKVILKEGSADCVDDLMNASYLAGKLGSCIGYKDLIANQVFVKNFSTSSKGNLKSDSYSRKLVKKCGRQVTRLIKKNKKTIIKLADELYEKKRLKASEILAFFEGEDIHK